MDKNNKIAFFEQSKVRREWKDNQWYFSVIDIIAILSQSDRPRKYWDDLKRRLKDEGSELSEKIGQLKMLSTDGKRYLTDAANMESALRIIQSIPSPNAEPFKLWLASLGKERIDEIKDPELAMNRAREIYERKGYPKSWIDKRLRGINVRNTLTDEWKERGVKASNEFAILTDEIYRGTFEMTAREYKNFKSLDKENNLRDHMGDMELILTMLGEATTTELTRSHNSKGLPELSNDAVEGGNVAGRTRKDIEQRTKKKVVSKKNMLSEGRNNLDVLNEEILNSLPPLNSPQKPLDVSPKSHHYDK